MKYLAGTYRLQKISDLFSPYKYETMEVHLTAKEAKDLLGSDLFEKLGFTGWTWIGEIKN